MKRRCWDYNITYSDEKLPILTTDGAKTIENRTLYLKMNLNPILGVNQKYILKEKSE
jgi:LPS-assembly protein